MVKSCNKLENVLGKNLGVTYTFGVNYIRIHNTVDAQAQFTPVHTTKPGYSTTYTYAMRLSF